MLERLRRLRNGWSDEIPDQIVHSGTHKVRRKWFQAIVAELAMDIYDGEITDPAKIRKAKAFMERHTSKDFTDQELTTRQDIEAGNRIINRILEE